MDANMAENTVKIITVFDVKNKLKNKNVEDEEEMKLIYCTVFDVKNKLKNKNVEDEEESKISKKIMSNPKDNSPPWGALGGKIWKAVRPSTELEICTSSIFCNLLRA